uniref:PHD-type domain-containing protein n=1 Tax=Panagrolaimus sp. JU765 TaxID=591449 RepID=A0AC34R023_9BILA
MIQYDAFTYEVLKNSVKELSMDYGFTHADPNAVDDLTNLLHHFLDKVVTDSKKIAEIAGRKTFNSRDLVFASAKSNVDGDAMNEFMLWTKPIPPPQILPKYPVDCNDIVRPDLTQEELNERKEKGIPNYLPSLKFRDKNAERLAKQLELQNQKKNNASKQLLKPITSVYKNAGTFEDIVKVLSSHPRATNFKRNIASDVLVVDNRLAAETAERQKQLDEKEEKEAVSEACTSQVAEVAGPSSSVVAPIVQNVKEEVAAVDTSQNQEIRKKHKHKEKKHHKEKHHDDDEKKKHREDKEKHKKDKKKKKHRESDAKDSVLLSTKESIPSSDRVLPPVAPTVTANPPMPPEPVKHEKERHKKEKSKEKKEKKIKKEIKTEQPDWSRTSATSAGMSLSTPSKVAVSSSSNVSMVPPKMEDVKIKTEHGKSQKHSKESKSKEKTKKSESRDPSRPTTTEPPKENPDVDAEKKKKEKHKDKKEKDKKEKKRDKEERHKNETAEEREERRRLKKEKKKEKEERKRKLAEVKDAPSEPAVKKIKVEETPVPETPPLIFMPLKLRISLPPKPIATSTPIPPPRVDIPEKKPPPPPKPVAPLPESSSRPSSSRGFHSKYSSEKLRDKHEGIILSERVQLSKALKESMMTANATSSVNKSTRPSSELKSPVRKKKKTDEILKEKKEKLHSPVVSNPVAIVEPVAGTSTTSRSNVDKDEEKYWICPECSVMYADGVDMVLCERCHYWYHWHCVGLTAEPLESEWYCRRCAEKLARKKQKELNYF